MKQMFTKHQNSDWTGIEKALYLAEPVGMKNKQRVGPSVGHRTFSLSVS